MASQASRPPLKDARHPFKPVQLLRDGGGFDHSAQRREIAREHGDAARLRKGLRKRADDLAPGALRRMREQLRPRFARAGQAVGVQQRPQLA